MPHEASGQIALANEPQEGEHYYYVVSIEQSSLSLKGDIKFIEKNDGKTQWSNIYEVIEDILFEKLIISHHNL